MAPGLWKILGCAVVWITLSHAALGQERYALLIGNKDYSAKVGALSNPLNDVSLVKTALVQAGFKSENIEVVRNANGGVINKARLAFAQKLRAAGPDALGFF